MTKELIKRVVENLENTEFTKLSFYDFGEEVEVSETKIEGEQRTTREYKIPKQDKKVETDAFGLAHCTKCGEVIHSEEDSLCGRCIPF